MMQSLRNVELTGPYFHNGSIATLQQVVEFYSRGGNFASTNIDNLDANIREIGKLQNNPTNQRQVVDFLVSLTDERVRFNRAPFDHPELVLNQGASGGELSLLADLNIAGQSADATIDLPATGAGGQATPVASFLGLATTPTTFTAVVTAGDGTLGTPVTDGGADFALSLPSPNPVGARLAGLRRDRPCGEDAGEGYAQRRRALDPVERHLRCRHAASGRCLHVSPPGRSQPGPEEADPGQLTPGRQR